MIIQKYCIRKQVSKIDSLRRINDACTSLARYAVIQVSLLLTNLLRITMVVDDGFVSKFVNF